MGARKAREFSFKHKARRKELSELND
jgi:hypothetical protein